MSDEKEKKTDVKLPEHVTVDKLKTVKNLPNSRNCCTFVVSKERDNITLFNNLNIIQLWKLGRK